MKTYAVALGMMLCTLQSFSQTCSTLVLGRTVERLPSTNTNAFIQQESPLNTVHQQCDYVTGGIIITYPSGWFTTPPLISVSIEPLANPLDPTVQYSAQVISNDAGQTTIFVVKNLTSESCISEGECGGVSSPCGVLPTCSGGSCSVTQEQMCSDSADCNTCSSECTDCDNSACSTTPIPGGGGLFCTGQCTSGNFCVGSSVCNGAVCQGECSNCVGVCDSLTSPCYGTCSNCVGDCFGECNGSFSNCDGNSPSCSGNCQGQGECTSCTGDSYGSGTCSGSTMNGNCNETSTNCEGRCEDCTVGLCNGLPSVTLCNGLCTLCQGTCSGSMDSCSGNDTFIGHCTGNISGGTWTGFCSSCAGDCLGSVATTGRTCLYSCNGDSMAVEATTGEVRVHIYSIATSAS